MFEKEHIGKEILGSISRNQVCMGKLAGFESVVFFCINKQVTCEFAFAIYLVSCRSASMAHVFREFGFFVYAREYIWLLLCEEITCDVRDMCLARPVGFRSYDLLQRYLE